MPNVPPPSSGLGSNSNYIFYSNCKPLLGLSVTIQVSEDIVCQSASGSTVGFGFQLNAYSPMNETSAWQQYVVALFGSELIGAVDNWPLSGNNIINDSFNLASVPNAKTLPAGYQLGITLHAAQTWRTSWDLAVTGGWGSGDSGLLLYDRAAGVGAFYAIDNKGGMNLLQQYNDWRTSWDLAVTGGWGSGDSGLLLYDRAAGVGAFYAIDNKGGMSLLRQYDDWRTSWDLAVTGGWGSGESGLLLYDRAAGLGAFYTIDNKGGMNLLLQYDDSIIGATYRVTDNAGKTVAEVTQDLTSLAGGTAGDLAPIIAFELNLVGPVNGESAVLSSGAGNFVYSAATSMTVLQQEPACAESGYVTAELANSVYSQLSSTPANSFTQSFNVTPAGVPMIRKTGKVRPGLLIPAGKEASAR
jgi:hypothetical protein